MILKSRELIEYGTQAAVSIWEEGSFRAQEKVETEEGKDLSLIHISIIMNC